MLVGFCWGEKCDAVRDFFFLFFLIFSYFFLFSLIFFFFFALF